jgi:signal transduction histidine kinase
MTPSEVNAAAQQLGQAIDEGREQIETRWLQWVQRDIIAAAGVELTQLRNGMPDYLDGIVRLLCGSGPKTFEQNARSIWSRVAREHGVTRVRIGFDIGQLVHEFVVLRHVIRDIAKQKGVAMDAPEAILADVLDAAISEAVQAYVRARDHEAQRKQAEHLGFLTHELRNPLGTATLTVSQLRRRVPPEHAALLDKLERSHRRLTDLIDNVLLAEKLEAGKVDSRPMDLSLGQVMEGALEAAQAVADHKGLELRVTCDPTLHVHVDPLLTRSAIQNLADNATKFTDEGRVDVTVEELRDDFVVHVRDTCGGIPAEDLRSIFEPFERGSSREAGTGLGLAIAKHAVEAQGGSIHAESASSAGCHFWITLPKWVVATHDDQGSDDHVSHSAGQ